MECHCCVVTATQLCTCADWEGAEDAPDEEPPELLPPEPEPEASAAWAVDPAAPLEDAAAPSSLAGSSAAFSPSAALASAPALAASSMFGFAWERNYEQLLVTEFDGKYFERMDRETIRGKGREYAEEQAAVYAYSYVAGCAVAHCVFEECITRLVAEHRDDEIADIDCEKFGKEHGIEDAYDEFSEKQLNQLKIDDDKEFLGECRPLFCPKCETRMEQKTLEAQFGSSANAMTARSVGCHVCPICGRITFDDDDMRAARGYKETVKLAIDGVAGGSITDYGRRNAENYGARWERYYREGYLERYFARLDEALAEAAERGDVAYIGNRWAHSQVKAEAEGWVRRKTERWCKIAEAIERYASQGRTDEFEKALEEGRADAILSELGLDGAYAYY